MFNANNLEDLKKEYDLKLNTLNQKKDYQNFIELNREYRNYLLLYTEKIENEMSKIWIEKIKIIYPNFRERNDINLWIQIFKEDVCNCVEKQEKLRDLLIIILMSEKYINQNILKLINEKFALENNKEDLYKKFPQKFINKLINNIKTKEYPSYEFFDITKDLPYDEFLKLFYEFDYSIKNNELKDAKNILKQIELLGIQHPQLDVNKFKYYFEKHNIFKYKKILRELENNYGSLIDVKLSQVHFLMNKGKHKAAGQILEEVIKLEPDNNLAINGLCSCYIVQEKMIEAKNLMDYLLDIGYLTKDDERVSVINDFLIKKLKKSSKESEQDSLKLIDIYIDINNYEKALKTINSTNIKNENKVIYYALLTIIYSCLENYTKALENAKIYEYLSKRLTEKQKTDLKTKFGYKIGKLIDEESVLLNLGFIYFKLGHNNTCLECVKNALKGISFDSAYLLNCLNSLDALGEFELIIQICDKFFIKNEVISSIQVKALYELGRFCEAYDICNEVLQQCKYYLDIHIYKMKILTEWNETEKVQEIIGNLKSEGIKIEEYQ